MKVLTLFFALISLHSDAQDWIVIDFREDVIVWQERETWRGRMKMFELYSGKSADIGPFRAIVPEPSCLMVSCIETDEDYFIDLPDGLNCGTPMHIRWDREDMIIRCDGDD